MFVCSQWKDYQGQPRLVILTHSPGSVWKQHDNHSGGLYTGRWLHKWHSRDDLVSDRLPLSAVSRSHRVYKMASREPEQNRYRGVHRDV